jgi:hypothetical protein
LVVDTSELKTFWGRQPRGVRIWGTVGLVGLFGLVAVGVYLGIQVAGYAHETQPIKAAAPPSPSPAAVADRLDASPALPPSPSASVTSAPVRATSAPKVPDAPGNVRFFVRETFETDLNVTVRWTIPSANGSLITTYLVDVRSGSDFHQTLSSTTTEATVDVPCTATCDGQEVDATVQAVNAIGFGPQGFGAFRGGLPVLSLTDSHCGARQPITNPMMMECAVSVSNYTDVTWTVNGVVDTQWRGSPSGVFPVDCGGFNTYVKWSILVAVSDAAGSVEYNYHGNCLTSPS